MKQLVFLIKGLLIGGGLLLIQGCMSFRTTDAEAVAMFARADLTLLPHTMTVGKRSLHYVSVGSSDRPTLVFVHGSPGSWTAFEDYLKDSLLLAQYRLVSLDRPGFGDSNFGHAVGIQQQSALLSPVLHQLSNGQPMYLIGHSLGGPMVVKLAADNRDLPIRGVVILAGSVSPADEPRELWRYVLDLPLIRGLLPRAIRASNHEIRLFKRDVVRMQPAFAQITCPTYIMHGDQDPLVPPPNAPYAQKMLVNAPHTELHWLAGANHFIPWTRHDSIRAVLLKMAY